MDINKKSLKLNMVLNAIKGLLSVFFPLITFPYITSVLGVDNTGKYTFASSIINYFLLVAALGIQTYAIREGAQKRNNMKEVNDFANEMFTVNVISTILSYAFLFIILFTVPKLYGYKSLIVILSLQILFTTIGIEWIYSIFEDYLYITLRSIFFSIISILLLFLFVKTQNDVEIYACISVFTSIGSNIVNYIHSRKYFKVHLTRKIDWKTHLKPILILFAMQIATTIYISSDVTLLGLLWNDRVVGVYSVSSKVYGVIKSVLSAIIVVSIPRLSSLLGEKKIKEYTFVSKDIYETLLSLVTPVIVLVILLRKEVILIISNYEYLEATSSLIILMIALFFCLGAWFWGQAILVPLKRENIVFKATVISAIINIVLNFLLIPLWKENAAALTTLIAEAIAFFIQWDEGKKYVNFSGIGKTIAKIITGCLVIVVIDLLCYPLKSNTIVFTIVLLFLSAISYLGIEILLKNNAIFAPFSSIIKKLKRI